jgi:hypothetical protein
MANIYKNAGFAISTTDLTTIYTVPAGRTQLLKIYKLVMNMLQTIL